MAINGQQTAGRKFNYLARFNKRLWGHTLFGHGKLLVVFCAAKSSGDLRGTENLAYAHGKLFARKLEVSYGEKHSWVFALLQTVLRCEISQQRLDFLKPIKNASTIPDRGYIKPTTPNTLKKCVLGHGENFQNFFEPEKLLRI